MAEIELSALSKQCLNRRIECMKKLVDEVNAWEYGAESNRNNSKMENQ